MSIVICSDCERWIDSDEDCDCFVGYYEPVRFKCKPNSDKICCEWCRENYEDSDA